MPILVTALIVAFLDGTFAIATYVPLLHGAAPRRIMQSVAAGVLGKASFDGGTATALLGTVLHFTVALGWTLGYALVLRRLAVVQKRVQTTRGALLVGAIYGEVIWWAMCFIVIPLSRANPPSLSNWHFWANAAWHPIGVGAPIVLLTESFRARMRAPALTAA